MKTIVQNGVANGLTLGDPLILNFNNVGSFYTVQVLFNGAVPPPYNIECNLGTPDNKPQISTGPFGSGTIIIDQTPGAWSVLQDTFGTPLMNLVETDAHPCQFPVFAIRVNILSAFMGPYTLKVLEQGIM